jgi:tetratricopeptide (TPR) repeat protein
MSALFRTHPALRIAWIAASCAFACATPHSAPAREEAAAASTAAELESRAITAGASAAAEARLRELFPEIHGEITRESIARALAGDVARFESGDRSAARSDAVRANAPASDPSTSAHDVNDRRERARAAIESGDYEEARRVLGALVVEAQIGEARERLARGDARGALAILDRSAEIAPRDARVLCLRGEAALRVGAESNEGGLVESALADYLGVARETDRAEAWLGASRASRWLQRTNEALEYARNGVRAWRSAGAANVAGERVLEIPPERTLAEAGFDAYRVARATTPDPSNGAAAAGELGTRTKELFDECKAALDALIARLPNDGWAWSQLSALYESEGSLADARSIALRGLDAAPRDEDLHQRLASITTALGGRAALLSTYAELKSKHPDAALVEWYPAVARFDAAVEELLAAPRAAKSTVEIAPALKASFAATRASFQNAEQGFARCRSLDPKYAGACRSYELLCRDGAGWCSYHAGDLDLAQKSFLSMEDLIGGGISAELEQKLASGIVGLHWVGGAYAARAQTENSLASLENLERAGKVYDFLHEYQPQDAGWANDSGFFNRDTAVALERKAQALAEQGKIDEANRLLDRARELMEKSFRAYADAARLAPDDVRIQNDAGLILTYYLQRDPERALSYLKRAQDLGEKQVPELARQAALPEISPEERDARKKRLEVVETALGDAYQNLGVLALTMNGDPKTARMWLEKSLTIGQDAREEVSGKGGYLEQCDAASAGRSNPIVDAETRWGAPKRAKSDKKTNDRGASSPPRHP